MPRQIFTFLTCSCVAITLLAASDEQVMRVGNGVSAPRVLSKIDPAYTREARAAYIQGTALYSLVVDATGHPRDIRVLSPIGYGLDEKGEEAIARWVFAPGMKDGKPVSIRAHIEVSFRFPTIPYDEKRDRQRTAYNLAMDDLKDKRPSEKTIAAIERLAQQKYPPAVYLLGSWMLHGEYVPRDPQKGLELIRKAADRNVAPALFELGTIYEKGEQVPADAEQGLTMIRQASMLGSVAAQFDLGNRYESGTGVEVNRERARYYFRLCAAMGVGPCQFHLGRLLIETPEGGHGDNVQAAAWLELASENRVPNARALAGETAAKLSPEQMDQMSKLKLQLLRRPR